MKNPRCIFLALWILTCFQVAGQGVWCPPGATWHYSFNNFSTVGNVEIKYVADTIIDSIDCHVLTKTRSTYDYVTGNFNTIDLGKDFTYLDSNIVYYYRFGRFFKLYDFNATANDSWQIAGWENWKICNDSLGTVQVDSTDSISYNGLRLKRMYVGPLDTSYSFNPWFPIVERLGSFDYMFPEPWCVSDVEEGGILRCYYDDQFGLLMFGTKPCDEVVGQDEVSAQVPTVQACPNPVKDQLSLKLNSLEIEGLEMKIYNSAGRIIMKKTIENQETTLNLKGLPEGLYLLVIINGHELIGIEKIKKTHHNNG